MNVILLSVVLGVIVAALIYFAGLVHGQKLESVKYLKTENELRESLMAVREAHQAQQAEDKIKDERQKEIMRIFSAREQKPSLTDAQKLKEEAMKAWEEEDGA